MVAGSKFTYYLFIGIFIAAIIVSLIYYVVNRGIFADYFSDRGELVDQLVYEYDLDGAGDNETILVSKYRQEDREYDYYLEIKGRSDLALKLEGFENDITFCEKEVLQIDTDNTAICVNGFVGVHSKNMQMIRYHQSKIEFFNFIKGDNQSNHIFSDSPSFEFRDYNNNQRLDLIVDLRDYDNNPLYDVDRMYYYFDTDFGFVYEMTEKIDQSENSLNVQGQIN